MLMNVQMDLLIALMVAQIETVVMEDTNALAMLVMYFIVMVTPA